MNYFLIFLTALYTYTSFPENIQQLLSWRRPESSTHSFPELARKYGYNKIQEYNLTTEDGYILKLFHIPGNQTKTVLLMHGILDSADTFIVRGRKSLAAELSNRGYDVWLGNARGSKYGRRHERLDPDKDKVFWDFSFHEIAVFDLPVFIDFILRENNVSRLSLIGHSQGNTLFYVLGSMKPEYNDKISVAVALGPVCYLNIDNFPFPLAVIVTAGPVINNWLLAMNTEEIFGDTSYMKHLFNKICGQMGIGYNVCAKGMLSSLAGEDVEEFEPEFFYSLIRHYPTSTSRTNALHILQVAIKKQFVQFDYGSEKNFKIYKSQFPSVYDLNKVTMKIALLVGKNDKVTPKANVALLKEKLPNVVSYHVMEREKFNHMDFVWGKHMYKYLFPHVIKLLETYS